MTNNCIFCKIAKKEIPSQIIYEDDKVIVILDKFPTTEGQSLGIVKEHVPYILDLDDETYTHVFKIAKKIAKALDKTFNPETTCIVVEGFQIDHTHIKLYPVKEKKLVLTGDTPADDEELKKIAKEIKANL